MQVFLPSASSDSVSSHRILYTPSDFARSSLMHLQETGSLQALKEHTSRREGLQSFLFIMVLNGSGELEYKGKTYALNAGSCVFIDCLHPYSHRTSANLWTLRWCHFYGQMLPPIYEKYVSRGGKPVFSPADSDSFISTLNCLYAHAESNDFIRDMRINEELNRLCTLIMAESWNPDGPISSAEKKTRVFAIADYLKAHYSEQISLEDLSSRFFINKFYLTRVFKEQYGVSIYTFLQSIRISHAKQMLRFTNKSIEEIGRECGLVQLSYFSRVFKQVEGVPPSVYRSQW